MINKCLELLKGLTGHSYVKLTNRGNSAIFAAFYMAKKVNFKPYILMPDQGGWLTYETFPLILGFKVKKIKTDNGLIDLNDLKKEVNTGSAFIFNSYAGYFANQDVEEIQKICHGAGCLVIEDISGSIGDEKQCRGGLVDMEVCSFNSWKTINLGHGGMISTKKKDWFEKADEVLAMNSQASINLEELHKQLSSIGERREFLDGWTEKVKSELKGYDIIHRDRKGINVCVRFPDEGTKNEIIEYCEKNNLEFVICPKDIRVNTDAISIEIKRLESKNI